MNRQDYIEKLRSLINLEDDFTALVYFVVKDAQGSNTLKKADMKADVINQISEKFKGSITNEIKRVENDENFNVMNLSSFDERANVVYIYDLPEEPSLFEYVKEAEESHQPDYYTGDKVFRFNKDVFSNVESYITRLGTADNNITVYRKCYNINIYKQGEGRVYLFKSDTQIDIIQEDFLKMDTRMDIVLMNNDFCILNLSLIDNDKDFAPIILNHALTYISEIERIDLIKDIDKIKKEIKGNYSFAKKFLRAVISSPVTNLPKDKVIKFINSHSKLKNVLKIEKDKIVLSDKKSINTFIKLLNDDLLKSNLTNIDYEASSKDKVK